MVQKLFALLLCLSCLFVVTPANETDQYNLPPKPIADIAPEVEAYVVEHIRLAIFNVNADIAKHEQCLTALRSSAFETREGSNVITEAPPNRPTYCGTEKEERAILEKLRSDDAVAKAVHEQLGAGNIFISNTGKWLNTHKFENEPARYVTPYKESIYWTAPIDYATISPTIRVYGVEFGTDKIDHIFQQGYTYYRKYNAALKAGKSDAEALKTVVAYGRFTENTFFGYTVSGVYSNADLAANIAGLKFYLGLTDAVDVGSPYGKRPPTFTKRDGLHWGFDDISGKHDDLLRPFITDHLNEALNPSNYLFFLYPVVKSVVQKRACPEWRAAFPDLTRDELTRRTAALTTWNGLDYGYKQTSRQVRLADTCFREPKPKTVE